MLPLLQTWKGASAAPSEGAWAAAGWNSRGLCFRVVAEDSDIVTTATGNDQKLWTLGDTIEFFLKPGVEQDMYWEIHVSPNALVMDIMIESRERFRNRTLTWEEVISHTSGVEPRVTVDAGREWTVEAVVPWAAFRRAGPPDAGELWPFAVCRYNYWTGRGEPELSTTAPLRQANFHNYEDYDLLAFA